MRKIFGVFIWIDYLCGRLLLIYLNKNFNMKRFVFAAIAAAAMMGCENVEEQRADDGQVREITFACGGFGVSGATRALEADGKGMTDLWVLDYHDGALVQQIHQSGTDADFGAPTMRLRTGEHQICFVASRGTGAAVDTEAHTIVWTKPSDTFHKSITIDVKPSSAAHQEVTLERVVTRLRLTLTDEVPADAASITISPSRWHTGLDYLTGEPTAAISDYTGTVALPESVRGTTGLQLSIFGMSSAAQWTTDVALTSTDADGVLIGQGTIKSAPMRRNIITNCTGPLFSSVTVGGIVLNTEWLPDVEITW